MRPEPLGLSPTSEGTTVSSKTVPPYSLDMIPRSPASMVRNSIDRRIGDLAKARSSYGY